MNSNLLVFWPTASMTDTEKLQASTRFIVYATVILYLYQRDPRIFAIALISIFVLYYSYKRQHPTEQLDISAMVEKFTNCNQPTRNNPVGNRLLGNGYLAKSPTCDNPELKEELVASRQIPQPQQELFGGIFERAFYTTPLAMHDWPAGQKNFAEFLGQPLAPNEPFCKDDTSNCQPSFTGRPGGGGGSV